MAPSFTLPDQDGSRVVLRDLRGRWVVLYFYPRDDTPGCTIEACEFTGLRAEFARLGAEILGCSPDGAASHTRFIDKHGLGVRLLTDEDRAVMQAYGAFGEKTMYGKKVVGVIRSTVLIGPDGEVAHHWPKVKAAGHAEQVLGKLAELQGKAGTGAPAPAKGAVPKAVSKPAARRRRPANGAGARARRTSRRTS